MKKLFGTIVMTVMVCGFFACGNTKTPTTEQTDNASVEIEEVEDTSAVVTRGGTESEGFGRCGESGCNCKAFKGRGDTCGNCGHAYRKHY